MSSKYLHSRLKCLFHWKKTISNWCHCRLYSISGEWDVFSHWQPNFVFFEEIWGTLQYFHNMLLDALAKMRRYGVYTFFLAQLAWIIQVTAIHYGEELTDEQLMAVDWDAKYRDTAVNNALKKREEIKGKT